MSKSTASPHFDTGKRDRWPVHYVTAAGPHEPDGTPVVGRRKDRARREQFLREWDRFDSLSPSEQQAYMVLGRKRERTGPPAVIRRTPAARPAARRPRRRSGASSSRAGPDDDSGESEPPAGVVGGTEPRRAWRADTWTRWRCCPECSAVLEYLAGGLYCPRAACPLHDVGHPPADPRDGR